MALLIWIVHGIQQAIPITQIEVVLGNSELAAWSLEYIFFWILHAQWGQNIFKVAIGFLKSIHHVSRIKLLMSLSDSFTNLETTNLQKKFRETEFVYLFLCTKNVNNNIQFRRLVVSKYSWNHLMSRSYISKICFKHCTQKYKIYQRL